MSLISRLMLLPIFLSIGKSQTNGKIKAIRQNYEIVKAEKSRISKYFRFKTAINFKYRIFRGIIQQQKINNVFELLLLLRVRYLMFFDVS